MGTKDPYLAGFASDLSRTYDNWKECSSVMHKHSNVTVFDENKLLIYLRDFFCTFGEVKFITLK